MKSLRNPIALVAPNSRFVAVRARLEKALGREILSCSVASILARLGPNTDGFLLLVVSCAEDAEAIRPLVQEVCLQRWPLRLILLETAECARSSPCAEWHPRVAARFTWPGQAARSIELLREPMGDDVGFPLLPPTVDEMIGHRLGYYSPSLLPLVERLTLAAQHDFTALLTGETGTGKTFLARLMHDCSPRRQYPFVSVPCGSVPPELLESAFFGHVKGAFTGADRDRQGKFSAAAGGTILLDEIDTLGLAQQASLLRVIETGEFELVGCNRTIKSTARIIAASNWDLEQAVKAGKFREDLFYRLNIMAFHLPPLRERIQDIAPLTRGMTARFCTKFHKDLFDIAAEAMVLLESHPWPGNIRQLENVMQQAILCSSGSILLTDHLPHGVRNHRLGVNGHGEALFESREWAERGLIQRALTNSGNNRLRAARALGISRVTLYKKMRKYGLMT